MLHHGSKGLGITDMLNYLVMQLKAILGTNPRPSKTKQSMQM